MKLSIPFLRGLRFTIPGTKTIIVGSLSLGAILLSACNLNAPSHPIAQVPTAISTLAATQATTPINTATPTETAAPSATFTITPTLTNTLPPAATFTPSPSPFPLVPTQPAINLALDYIDHLKGFDSKVANCVGRVSLAVINSNDKPKLTVTPGTPPPASGTETIYLTAPDDNVLYKVIELPATTSNRVYWSPNCVYMAYFLDSGTATGLYVLNVQTGGTLRLFAISNLNQRGIQSEPVWSPDSRNITLTLATAYDVDIFSAGPDGSNFVNLTQDPSLDFWPTWSPDGQYLAFVSDRDVCPTREPNAPKSCYKPQETPPDGGNLFVLDLTAHKVRKLTDSWVTDPPRWISNNRIGYVAGARGDPTAGNTLGWADVNGAVGATEHLVTKDDANVSITGEAWSSDGKMVVYQVAGTETAVIVRDETGTLINKVTDLKLPQAAFSASWSPDGSKIIIGGRSSRCAQGMILADSALKTRSTVSGNLAVCNPVWSPDGRFIAFSGVKQASTSDDGRIDAYISAASGYGTRSVTTQFGGQIQIVGWVGGSK